MPLLILIGIFYVAVLPILVFVALGRSSDVSRRNRNLEGRLDESERRLHELSQLIFDQHKSAAATTSNETAATQPKANPPSPIVEKAASEPVLESIPLVPVAKFDPPPLPPQLAPRKTPGVLPPPAVNRPAIKEVKDPGAEITLGARWATRMGIGFLVVAIVFFGIYISKYSTPAVRLLEVFALAAVVAGLGMWLERQAREFGEAVFAGGLAIFYFAAFAAHAISAMRVIVSVETGLVVQFVAVVGIAAIAWRRNRPYVATMSIALGMVSCFFALHQDRLEITLGAALGLLLVAALLRVLRGWIWPLAVGYAGAQICYGASVLATKGFTLEGFFKDGWNYSPFHQPLVGFAPWPGFMLVFPAAYFLLVIGADLWAEIRGRKDNPKLRTGMVLIAAVFYGLGGWWGGAVFGHPWDSYSLLSAAVLCLTAGLVYRARKDLPEIYEILFAAAGVWTAIYFLNEYAGWIRWLALMIESFVFAWRVRRQDSKLAWACVAGAWACSWVMACQDANLLPVGVGMWSLVRLKFAAWPLVSLALWAWVEKMPRTPTKEENWVVGLGGILAAVGTAVLGRVAWTDPALSWLFLAVAALAAIFGLIAKAGTAWPTVWLLLPLSMWLYAPLLNSSALEIFPALACFTVAVLAVTYGLHRRAGDEQKKRHASISEIIGFLSLLYAWVRGFEAMSGGSDQLALALNLAALGLAALAWRGPWRLAGDLAFVWALAALGAGWWRHDLAGFLVAGKMCFVIVLVLGWLWGVLGRREKSAVFLLRQDKLGLHLPGILFAGWALLAIPPWMSNGEFALILAGSAALFALVGKREWLPGGVIAAILLSIAALEKNFDFPVRALADCWIPAIVALAFLFQSWLLARRFRKDNRASFDILIFIAAGISLTAFDWPVLGLVGGAQQSITLLWAGAGATVFIAGLAARLRSFRYVGLGGLALCVPRLFLVDITDQLGRIFAFGGLAVLLLAIGFSYHKLRPWLAKSDPAD
jgi:hypothetical protein